MFKVRFNFPEWYVRGIKIEKLTNLYYFYFIFIVKGTLFWERLRVYTNFIRVPPILPTNTKRFVNLKHKLILFTASLNIRGEPPTKPGSAIFIQRIKVSALASVFTSSYRIRKQQQYSGPCLAAGTVYREHVWTV